MNKMLSFANAKKKDPFERNVQSRNKFKHRKKKVLSDPDSGFPINGVYLSTTVEFSEILPNA